MKPVSAFLLCFFFLGYAYAQNINTAADHQFSLLLGPAILSSHNQYFGLQPGVQYRLSRRSALLAEYAFAFRSRYNGITDERHHRLSAEAKWFMSKRNKSSCYLSLQSYYAARRFRDSTTGYFYDKNLPDSTFYYDEAAVQSPVFVVALKVGREVKLGKKITMDFFMGVGVRRIFTSYGSFVNLTKREGHPFREFPAAAIFFNETQTRFHATGGFRFGYALSHRK